MENKQDVVEKRIKPGIIRRRAKKTKEEPKPAVEAKEETKPAEAAAEAAPAEEKKKAAAKPKTTKKKVPAKAKPAETKEEPKAEQAPVEEKAAPAKKAAEGVKGPRDLPEGPPVGTIIQLPKKPAPEAKEAAETGEAEAPIEPEEAEEKVKAKRPSKKLRSQKEDLNIDGFGRVSNVSQIARISTVRDADRVFQPSRTGRRRRSRPRREGKKTPMTMPKAAKRVVKMGESIQVSDLAQQLGARANEVVKKLMDLGSMVTLNQYIDFDTATVIAHDYGWEVKRTGFEEEKALETQEDKPEELKPRAPVVTVMGHVDHGKTSLLDAIRSAKVAEGEAGGITQHIGSYQIHLGDDKVVTFLDTPGHEAFTAMRARGASITDLVVLVVAADDGVMPQTVEAINHAKAAEVPIIVAVNKIDKPEANPDNVKRQLSEHGLLAEDWGGDILFSLVSAKTKKGIDELLEQIFLQSEVLELKANPNKLAKGVIVEARLDKARGAVATALIQEGTLKIGDAIVAGTQFGRIRAMINDRGENVESAGPSVPVEILGLEGVPEASDPLQALEDEKAARQVVEHRQTKAREEQMAASSKMSLEELYSKMQSGEVKELPVILKADVHGSLEAVRDALEKIPSEKAKIKVLHGAVGGITESDVMLAKASNGIIIGFNVRPDNKAREISEQEKVEIKVYKVIYEVVDDVKKAMEGLLEPTIQETYLGRAEVLQVFNVSKIGKVAGCQVVDGKILRGAHVRLLRDSVIVHEGKLSSLKRFKDDAKEVKQGQECGLGFEDFNDLKEGDVVECYQLKEIKTEL